MVAEELHLRVVRDHDRPLSHEFEESLLFGLQDVHQVIEPPVVGAGGQQIFDFTVMVRPDPKSGRPKFSGRFVSGKADDRFVYLSWRSVPRQTYVNRLKARLGGIDWPLIEAALESGGVLCADMTDWQLGDKRKQVAWRLVAS